MRNRIRILIERHDIGAGPQNFFGVSTAAAGRIDHQGARARGEQLDRFRRQHRAMISEIFHFLRLLFNLQWTGREPDRPLKQHCIHDFVTAIRSESDKICDVLVSWSFFFVRTFPFLQIPNFKSAASSHQSDLAF